MHRGTLTAVGVAVLLVTAGFVGGLASADDASAQTQDDDDDGTTISVSATGQVEAEPDQAVLQVAVLARGDDANAVRERLAENVTRMRAALRNATVGDDQIRTVAFRIDQRFGEVDGERRPVGFEGVHAFEITLSNVSRAGEIIDVAVENGADRVDSVELTLSEERRREVRAEALRAAMANARADADVIAESANLTVTGVRSAAAGDLSFSPVRAEFAQARAGDAGGTAIESGPVTVTAQVSVTYNATG
jgi:hypothetical protein